MNDPDRMAQRDDSLAFVVLLLIVFLVAAWLA